MRKETNNQSTYARGKEEATKKKGLQQGGRERAGVPEDECVPLHNATYAPERFINKSESAEKCKHTT